MAEVAVTGKYQKHVLTGTVLEDEASQKLRIDAWALPEGKAAPKKAGLVGETYDSVGKAGVEAVKAIRANRGLPPLTTEMRVIFYAEGAEKPVNARSARPEKPKAERAPRAPRQPKTETEKPARGKKAAKDSKYSIFRKLEDGRWFCDACMSGFDGPEDGSFPEQCANGHKPDEFADIVNSPTGIDGAEAPVDATEAVAEGEGEPEEIEV